MSFHDSLFDSELTFYHICIGEGGIACSAQENKIRKTFEWRQHVARLHYNSMCVCVCVCVLLEFGMDKPSHTRRALRCTMTMDSAVDSAIDGCD